MARKRQSRASRYAEAAALVEDAQRIMEELKEELEEWLGNMPENLQSSSKADALQEAIDTLDNNITNLEDVTSNEPEFPGMMG